MKYLLWLGFTMSVLVSPAQENKVDPTAVMIMDRMSAVIGDLRSCSYTLSSLVDTEKYPYGMVALFGTSEVQMVGPDKLLVHTRQNGHHKGYWYNGESLTYYSFDENNYVTIPAPQTIMATIDSLRETYEIDFPAGDFFYPTFTDDILENFDRIHFVGKELVDGKVCFHIRAENEDMLVQFWITDDAFNLPVHFIIKYKNRENTPEYRATFSNWELNPELPKSIFEFSPPPGARLIGIMSSKAN